MTVNTRVRWNEDEKLQLASHIARLRHGNPGMSLMDALREAQRHLPLERQREVRTWAIVAPILDAKIQLAADVLAQRAKAQGQPSPAPSAAPLASPPSEPPVSAEDENPATEERQPEASAQDSLSGSPCLRSSTSLEQLVDALCASQKLRQMLMEMLRSCLAEALLELRSPNGARGSDPSRGAGPPAPGVLLAGFPRSVASTLKGAVAHDLQVQVWTPDQPTKALELSQRNCSIAVIPEGMDDLDAVLRERGLQVLTHEGSAERLAQTLLERLAQFSPAA